MVAIHAAVITLAASPFAIIGIGLAYAWAARRPPAIASPVAGEGWYPRTLPPEAPTLMLGATADQVEVWIADLATAYPDQPASSQNRKD